MRRVGSTLAAYLFHKGVGLAQTVRQDLRTFELPKHKEDFFDRLQEDKQEKRKPLGDHHRRQEPSSALGLLKRHKNPTFGQNLSDSVSKNPTFGQNLSAFAGNAEESAPPPVIKEGHPVFQTEEVRNDLTSEADADVELLHQKEEQLLTQIMKDPKNPSSYKKLGKIYLHLENISDARKCFEYAVKLGARDPELRELLTQTQRGV